jgi:hypothetical protein
LAGRPKDDLKKGSAARELLTLLFHPAIIPHANVSFGEFFRFFHRVPADASGRTDWIGQGIHGWMRCVCAWRTGTPNEGSNQSRFAHRLAESVLSPFKSPAGRFGYVIILPSQFKAIIHDSFIPSSQKHQT